MPPAGALAHLALLVFALALRMVLLSSRGDFLEFDETFYLLIARSLLEGGGYQMNGLPQVAFPPLPALVNAAVGLVVEDPARAARLLSAVLSAALILPAAALARRVFGPSEGLLTAAFVAVMPSLMTFAPVSRPYAESLYFGAEPLYLLIVTAAGLFLARAASSGRPADAAGSGLLIGLAYLTRNEAALLAPAGAIVLLLSPRRRWATAAMLLGTASLVAAPYPLYLHRVTHEWSVSGKSDSAVLIRDSVSMKVLHDDASAFEAAHYAMEDSGRAMRSSYWGFDPQAPPASGPGRGLIHLSPGSAARNLRVYFLRLLPILLPWILWPFMLVGAAALAVRLRRDGARSGRSSPALAMAAMAVPSIAVCLVLFVEPRHHLSMVPLLAALSAHGLVRCAGLLAPRLRSVAWGAAAILCGALLWTTLGQLAGLRRDDGPRRYLAAIRSLGERLDARLPPGEPIMSWNPAIAYYARRPWRVMPADRLDRIAAYALRRGAGILVYETAVHGPPPGSDPSAPFSIVRLGRADPDAVRAGALSLRLVDSDPLYRTFDLEIAGRAPVGVAASSEDREADVR